jgi:hypothetical protein
MPETIDTSGLPESVVNDIRQLVNTLRGQLSVTKEVLHTQHETTEEWAIRLMAWAQGHPMRSIEFDDSRESIYSGRGE